ncbi:unnamed protein product [Bemisia tabaci]|uniref:Alpha 1,4-glycosyltransferase domain-containing protein n=1 Tax=Bemisia tabaci TaxID=7038 RepID=A0A9P0A2X3_BEMTA|nr:unnamed protein product [Bemisia tabaci]
MFYRIVTHHLCKLAFLLLIVALFFVYFFVDRQQLTSFKSYWLDGIDTNTEEPRVPVCYKLPQDDERIPDVSDYRVQPNSIFFLETSCRNGTGLNLTIRQACTYESAAKAHPDTEILLLFPSPISLEDQPSLRLEMSAYPNLRLLRMNVERFVLDTPFEHFDFLARPHHNPRSVAHASDLLRLITLWKYGGTYLDSEFIVMEPLNSTVNYVAAADEISLNNAVLNINISSENGKQVIDELLEEFKDQYDLEGRTDGPKVVTRLFNRICNETEIRRMTPEKCMNFTVYPAPELPPSRENISRNSDENADQADKEEPSKRESQILDILKSLSKNKSVDVGSKLAFEIFAAEFCPVVYSILKGRA